MKERRLIRNHIRDLLKGKKIVPSDRVVTSRSAPSDIEKLPVILIYTRNENVSAHNEAPKSYKRFVEVVIEVIDTGDDDEKLSDQLDDMADKIEEAIEYDETLGGKADRLALTSLQSAWESGGQSPLGSLILTYDVLYYQDVGAHCFPDLEQVGIEHKIAGENKQNPKELLDIPTT